MNKKGFTLLELLITVAIIGILAMIGIPAYLGQQKRAARTEAYTNLENLRLLEEQFFAENGTYAPSRGVCAADNAGNIALIRSAGGLTGFRPGADLSYSYCIELDLTFAGAAASCFRARAFGNTVSRVSGDIFAVDCNNTRNF